MTRKDFERLKELSKQLHRVFNKMQDIINYAAKVPDGMPYSNTGTTSNPTEDDAIKHEELCEEYIDIYGMMTDIINKETSKDMRTLLKCRYVNFMGWKEISRSLGKSEDALESFFRRKIK